MERRIHLVSWGVACRSKEKGGLGIKSLTMMNKVLLGKWGWRFVVEENSAWKKIINLKYHTERGGWFKRDPRGSYGVGLWKDISREARQLKQNCVFALGKGRRVKFWEDTV